MASLADEDDDAVIVEGERREREDPDEAGESVTVVPLDTRLPPGSDVADAVQRAPGATVRRLGGLGSYAAVSLRGSAQRQVQIHLDGLPLNPDGSSAVNLAALPLSAIDRVLVWRGAAPPQLAASPIGGVVDLRTREQDSPLTIGVEGGSWTTGRATASVGTTVGKTRMLVGASALTSQADFVAFDDLSTPDTRTDDQLRRRDGNDRHQASALLQIRAMQPGGWRALAATTVREEGLAGPITLEPIGRLRTLWGLVSAGRSLGTGSQIRGWAQVREERVQRGAGSSVERTRFAQAGLHGHTARYAERGQLGLSGQARVDLQRGVGPKPLRAAWTAVPYARWTPTEQTALEPVLHTQLWWDRQDGESQARLALNPRISVRSRIGEHWVLHAAGGRAIRPPDFLELYGDRGATKGNPDLRPERSLWADGGVRYVDDAWGAELGLFASDAVDRIVFVQNGTGAAVPINSDPSVVSGLEAAVSGQAERVDARLAATWTESWIRSGSLQGRRLPRIPRLGASADLGVRPIASVRIGLAADWVSGNAWDSANQIVAPPRLLIGTDLRVDPGGSWPAFHLGVRNLENRIVQAGPMFPTDPAGPRAVRALTDFAGYPLPGRTFIAGLTWTPRREPTP